MGIFATTLIPTSRYVNDMRGNRKEDQGKRERTKDRVSYSGCVKSREGNVYGWMRETSNGLWLFNSDRYRHRDYNIRGMDIQLKQGK